MCKKLFFLTSFILVSALAGTNVVFGDFTIDRRISAGSDDAEEAINPGYQDCYNTSTDLEILDDHTDNGGRQIIGMNFRDIGIPPGANISNAYIEFVCDETKDGSAEAYLLIWGHLTPNPNGFATPFVISNRPKTGAKVPWEPEPWSAVNQKIQTVDISSIIQELIDQSGWVSGNAIEIIVGEDTSKPTFTGSRCAVSYDGSPSQAPLLHIEWSLRGAKRPNPIDGQIDVSRDVVLTWTPGVFAAPVNGHKVYFSENFDDVKNGIGGIAHSASSYAPGRLDFNTTYYWRVDEVNGPPDYTVYEGRVWSFTTELLAYPIENVTATASSQVANRGPENTVNGSGLDESGLLHGKDGDENMWLSGTAGPQPTWIEYEFDKAYKLHEVWVWNSNDSLESVLGFGFKDVTIEYSTNGTDYTTLGTTHQFARAPGAPDYAYNTTIDFIGVGAKYVRLTANSNWGGILPQYGLSEVRFFYIPVNATKPYPQSGATDVNPNVVLDWRAGREATKHNVYVSTDEQAVIDGTAPVATVTEAGYGPLFLDLGVTHYWRVDEVNEAETPSTWESNIWSFTTADHLVVDDFEDYTDYTPYRIFEAWKDGFGYGTTPSVPPYYAGNGSSSIIGHEAAPFAEQSIVHSGTQSMPYFYNNNKQGYFNYSEATRTLSYPRDWTEEGVKTLTLWFHGVSANIPEPMYVAVANSGGKTAVVYHPDTNAAVINTWTEWNIPLTDFSNQGVVLTGVDTISIGFGNRNNPQPGGSGTMYFDDIRLYR